MTINVEEDNKVTDFSGGKVGPKNCYGAHKDKVTDAVSAIFPFYLMFVGQTINL